MLVSMTGFGQGEASNRFARVMVEMRTVNHRFLDVSIKAPRSLGNHEHEIKDLLKTHMRRGRVSVAINAHTELPQFDVRINMPLMEQYVTQLRTFAKKNDLDAQLDINTLAGMPEVFTLLERETASEKLWPLVKKSLRQAIDGCNAMRRKEGEALEADISARLTAIGRLTKQLEKRAPRVVTQHNDALKQRLTKIMKGARIDRDRWVTEVALLAERLDFTEEVTRLKSHMAQMGSSLTSGGAVSKKLTYLLQEVHREATTIASKAADAKVVEHVVSLKEESERLREQVQNIE